jgi:SAM-dependent methyltransferase
MEWFEEWFGPLYEELYVHRSPAEAQAQVEGLLRHCETFDGPVLDAGCGNGRHLAAMLARHPQAIGADLSAHLLSRARLLTDRVLRCDLRRCPFPDGAFSLVVSFFTGFGYFETPEEDAALLAEFVRILRPGGQLFLDLADPSHVRSHLVPRDEKELHGHRVVQSRFLNGDRVEKRIEIFQGTTKLQENWERVRLWEHGQLEPLAASLGLVEQVCLGDSLGNLWTPQSPRLGLLWKKAA